MDSFESLDYNFYGEGISKQKQGAWNIKFDLLPARENILTFSREHLTTFGEGEKAYDREQHDVEATAMKFARIKKKSASKHIEDSIDAFVDLDNTAKRTTKAFTYRYDGQVGDKIEWKILSDDEQVTQCPMEEQAKARKVVEKHAREAADMAGDQLSDESISDRGDIFPLPLKKDVPWNPNPEKWISTTYSLSIFALASKARQKYLTNIFWVHVLQCSTR